MCEFGSLFFKNSRKFTKNSQNIHIMAGKNAHWVTHSERVMW